MILLFKIGVVFALVIGIIVLIVVSKQQEDREVQRMEAEWREHEERLKKEYRDRLGLRR